MKNITIGFLMLLSFFINKVYGTAITSPVFTKASYERYEKVQATFSIDQTFTNPYDPDVVKVDAEVTSSSGSIYMVPCFYFIPTTYTASSPTFWNGTLNNSGATWMLRLAPTSATAGTYSVRIKVTEAGGAITFSSPSTFTMTLGSRKGFVRLNTTNNQFMKFDNGMPYNPVGYNVCWNDGRATEFFNQYMNNQQPNAVNWTRYWLTGFARQAIEWQNTHWSGWYGGLGMYSQQASGILDYTLDRCENAGVFMQLVMQHHGQVSTTVNSNWNENPYNVANAGGYLTNPSQFFNNVTAKNQTKKMYRYVIARWGYSPNILSWELFNEVQFTDGTVGDIDTWHDEMSQYLKSIDVNQHLVSTSAADAQFPSLDDNVALDQIQYHNYANSIAQSNLIKGQTLEATLNKSVLCGEFGVATSYGSGADILNDNEGDHVRKTAWIGAMNRLPQMFWYWDGFIDIKNLYNILKPLTDFIGTEDIVGMLPAASNVLSFQTNPGGAGSSTVSLVPGNSDFNFTNVPNPWSTTIDANGNATGLNNLSIFMQGSYQGTRSREASFTANFISVGSASITFTNSTFAGATNSLEIYLDGVLQSTFPISTAGTGGTFTLSNIPTGSHTIRFRNAGQDWFNVSNFSFTGITAGGRAKGYGYVGAKKVIGYVTDTYGDYANATALGTVSGAVLKLPVDAGNYTITFTNPQTGASLGTATGATSGGFLNVTLPTFSKDIAFKASYTGALVAANDDIIYEEGLGTNWSNYSYNFPNFFFDNTEQAHTGTKSVKAAPATTGYEFISFRKSAPINTAEYPNGISFWVYGGNTVGTNTAVKIAVGIYPTDDYAAGTEKAYDITPGSWQLINVPWSDIGNPTAVQRINIKDYSGTTGQTYYVDDVKLLTAVVTNVADVTFSPSGGPFTSAQNVTLATTTTGATIRYTTDGSTPTTTTGTIYTAPIAVASTTTIKAIAYKTGLTTSGVTSATYTINAVAATDDIIYEEGLGTNWSNYSYNFPNFFFDNTEQAHTGTKSVKAAPATTGYELISFRKSTPINTSAYPNGISLWVYGGNTVGTNATVKIAVGIYTTDNYNSGNEKAFDIVLGSWQLINVPWSDIGNPTVVKRINVIDYSGVVGQTYYVDDVRLRTSVASTVANVTFSPAGGTFSTPQNISLTTATAGATIRYTNDGSNPTTTTGTIYTSPINVSATTTIKAIAYNTGASSAVTSATYTFVTVAASDDIIYEEGLGTNWSNYSYDFSDFFFDNLEQAHTGIKSVKAAPVIRPYEIMSFRKSAPFNTGSYPSGISFWVYGGATVGTNTTVKLAVEIYPTDDYAPSTEKAFDITPGQWRLINVPWSDIGNPPAVQRVNIKDYSGTTGQTFYVDDARLLIAPRPLVFETIQAGNWNNVSTWMSNVVPSATDNVVIKHPVTATGTVHAKNVTYLGGIINFLLNGNLLLGL
ncbi:MAG: chitobiase/beta-hexosaminidase C-terminal domain-containing protein [Arcicella sp.]|jgi:hypothetical protein|nr:chitobiase/beta-hexosaminidase C-terminal domain-containing protein [Arcicella sp.]